MYEFRNNLNQAQCHLPHQLMFVDLNGANDATGVPPSSKLRSVFQGAFPRKSAEIESERAANSFRLCTFQAKVHFYHKSENIILFFFLNNVDDLSVQSITSLCCVTNTVVRSFHAARRQKIKVMLNNSRLIN